MKILLLIVSTFFSLIFYNLYTFSQWKNIVWDKVNNSFPLDTLSWNLLFESVGFFIIGIFFYFYFSYQTKSKLLHPKKWNKKLSIKHLYILLYTLLYIYIIYFLLFFHTQVELFIIVFIGLFILTDVLFLFVSKIKKIEKNKYNIRYFSLLLNYGTLALWAIFLFKSEFSLVLFLILCYSIFFHMLVHKKYRNYISLLFSISLSLFLIYYLYLQSKLLLLAL